MNPTESDAIVVYITAPTQEEALALAQTLVREKLAACVNIVPGIQSVYAWKDAIQNDTELLLVCKSRTERFDELKQRIQSLHSYEVPEIIALPVRDGAKSYLDWLRANTTID